MRLLVYGAADYALTVADLALDCGHEVVGHIDDHGDGPTVLGRFDAVVAAHRDCGIVMGIGYKDLGARWTAWQRVRASGLATPALVHPRAYVSRSAEVAPGCAVMAGANVDRRARLGEAVVLWPGVCVSHDAEVGANCFVSPNATLCGYARIGAHSFIGAGAAVADYCAVPAGSRLRMLERYSLHRTR